MDDQLKPLNDMAQIKTEPQTLFGPRPPVTRSDSRPNFLNRPPFPPTQPISYNNAAVRPPQPPSPRSHGPPQPFPPPRGPPRVFQGTPPGSAGLRPGIRPQSPFPRPPLLAQRPQIIQQNSVPASRPHPVLEESFNRSQTLDSSDIESNKNDDNRSPYKDQRPPSVASLERSFSNSSNPYERKLSESRDSIKQNSMDILEKKEECKNPVIEVVKEPEPVREPEIKGEPTKNGDHVDIDKSPAKVAIVQDPPTTEPKDKLELTLKTKGDNDSGVDESTQGNDQSFNGDSRSPRKPNKSRTSSTTPTKGRSLSRGSKTPTSLQSPDSTATTPGSAEKKKIPMNKVQVGAAPSPNLKVVKSKIGSLDNASYKPGGGRVKIENRKLDFKAGPRIEAKNDKYVPKGGEKKEIESARSVTSARKELKSAKSVDSNTPRNILSQKLEWSAKSKIGSLGNTSHKPKGGDKKIESVKLNFKDKATSKVGSKDNIKHQPGGGDIKTTNNEDNPKTSIENKKIELNASSKVGSLDNVKHKPTGGEKKIFDDKEYLKQKSGKASMGPSLTGSQHSIHSQEPKAPVADENLNQEH